MNALAKSARRYLAMVAQLRAVRPGVMRTPEYREAAEYLRQLYREYGRDAVRREIEAAK